MFSNQQVHEAEGREGGWRKLVWLYLSSHGMGCGYSRVVTLDFNYNSLDVQGLIERFDIESMMQCAPYWVCVPSRAGQGGVDPFVRQIALGEHCLPVCRVVSGC